MASTSNTSSEWSGTPVPHLPVEVVSFIMEYLFLPDRISASQTCRLWYEASRLRKLHENELIVITNNISTPLTYFAPESPKKTNLPPPHFTNFSFGNVEIKSTGEMRNFWPIYGPILKSLHFHFCEISEKTLSDCLQMCPVLETLHIRGCNVLFMSGNVLENVVHDLRLPFLTDIELMQINYISDAILNRFVAIAPNLSRLALKDCRISYHDAVYSRFYTELDRESINSDVLAGKLPLQVQKNVLTFQNILNILTLGADKIKTVSFCRTLIDGQSLKKMGAVLSQTSLQLESLDLGFCAQLQSGIADISNNFSSSLNCLDLAHCSRLPSTELAEIPKLTNLTMLDLLGCLELTDSTVRQFGCLKNLRSLNLSAMERITGPAILEGLRTLQHLKHLFLNHLLQLDSESVVELLRCLPPLLTLELEDCQIPLMDAALSIICQRHTTMTYLHLTRCVMLSDIGLTGMGLSVEALTTLPYVTSNTMKISLASKAEQQIISEENIKRTIEASLQPFEQQLLEQNESALVGVANLKCLRSLDLAQCTRITDMSIRHAFKFKELKLLNLSHNKNITDVSLQCVAVNCPSLQELWLKRCLRITDEGIFHVCQLQRLKTLDLEGCILLTDASLEALMQTKAPLKEVLIYECTKFTPDTVSKFRIWLQYPTRWGEPCAAPFIPAPRPPIPPWCLYPG